MVEELSEGPYGGAQSDYREWMVDRIEQYTGSLYDIGNLSAGTIEKLYIEIVNRDPKHAFKLEKDLRR